VGNWRNDLRVVSLSEDFLKARTLRKKKKDGGFEKRGFQHREKGGTVI